MPLPYYCVNKTTLNMANSFEPTIYEFIQELQNDMNEMRYDMPLTVAEFSKLLLRVQQELSRKSFQKKKQHWMQRADELINGSDPKFLTWLHEFTTEGYQKNTTVLISDKPSIAMYYYAGLSPAEAMEDFVSSKNQED
jgi:hypothetical protein